MRVLITGGGGFIGSHAVVETLQAGHEVVVVDDCSNVAPPAPGKQYPPSLERVAEIVGDKCAQQLRQLSHGMRYGRAIDHANNGWC